MPAVADFSPLHGQGTFKGAFGSVQGFGCSSFVADTGDFIHARNLDYESQGVFDRNPAVIYFHPEKAAS